MSIVESTVFDAPGESGSPVELSERYGNFIGGEWVAPTTGEYRENLTPSTGEPFCEIAHSGAQDIELALDAAHAAKDGLGKPVAGRPRRGAERGRGCDRGEPRDAGGSGEL